MTQVTGIDNFWIDIRGIKLESKLFINLLLKPSRKLDVKGGQH